MRTTTRLCLVISVVAAVGLASVPAASAAEPPGSVDLSAITSHHKDKKQNKKINKARKRAEKAHRRINNIKEWNFTTSEWNTSQQKTLDSLQGTVNAIVAGVPAITNGLLALQAAIEGPVQTGLEALKDGLLDIQDALEDETTGLVGLNLARPQFGVFLPNGDFQGGTGPVGDPGPTNPPFGPEDDAAAAGSVYVVDFVNDVSQRVYTVNVFPGTAPGAPPTTAAINCALAGGVCGGISAGTDDPNHVLVKIGPGNVATDGTVFGGFSVTALSG
jgi:hypothetical protein